MDSRMYPRDLYRDRAKPTVLREIDPLSNGTHESMLRAYHILERAKRMLEDRVPHNYILLLIGIMEGDDWRDGTPPDADAGRKD